MSHHRTVALLALSWASLGCAGASPAVEQPAARTSAAAPARPAASPVAQPADQPQPEPASDEAPAGLASCLPPALPRPAADADPERVYAEGRAHNEAGRLNEAAASFRHVAMHHAQHEAGPYAMMLHLDVLHRQAQASPTRAAACIGEIVRLLQQYHPLYCKGGGPSEACELLTTARCSAGRARADQAAEQQQWDEAARRYAALADQQPPCPKGDELLFNAAQAFRHAGQEQDARSMLERLGKEYPQSPLGSEGSEPGSKEPGEPVILRRPW